RAPPGRRKVLPPVDARPCAPCCAEGAPWNLRQLEADGRGPRLSRADVSLPAGVSAWEGAPGRPVSMIVRVRSPGRPRASASRKGRGVTSAGLPADRRRSAGYRAPPYFSGSSRALSAQSSQQTVISLPPTVTFLPPSLISQSHTGHFSTFMGRP